MGETEMGTQDKLWWECGETGWGETLMGMCETLLWKYNGKLSWYVREGQWECGSKFSENIAKTVTGMWGKLRWERGRNSGGKVCVGNLGICNNLGSCIMGFWESFSGNTDR